MKDKEQFNTPAKTSHQADPAATTVQNPSEKLVGSGTTAEREAAKLRKVRDELSQRPGPRDTDTEQRVGPN
jgi:hypothetical protein